MKKKLLLAVIMIAFIGSVFAADKVGWVNPAEILQKTIKGKEVLARLQAMSDTNNKKLQALQKELDDLQKELMNPALSAEARQKKSEELQNKRTNVSRFVEDAQKNMEKQRVQEFDKLQQEINPLIEQIATNEEYTIIFDVSMAGIAFANQSANITDKVIKAFDAKYSSGAKK